MGACDQPEMPAELGKDIYCPVCSYNLHGAPGEKCSECGYPLAELRCPTSQIPWVRQRELSRYRASLHPIRMVRLRNAALCYRAYWQTVGMVTSRNLAFCDEYAKSLRLSDARLFRWVTILHVYISVLLGTIIMCVAVAAKPPPTHPLQAVFPGGMLKPAPPLTDQACGEVWPLAVVHVCLLLFLFAATEAPSYFFHPRSVPAQQQNNGTAMSYYACGPVACSPVTSAPLLLFLIFLIVSASVPPDPWGPAPTSSHASFAVCSVVVAVIPAIVWWLNLIRIARRTMPQLRYRATAVAIGVPLLWLGLAFVTLLLLPVAVFSVLVAIVSFGD